MPGHSAVTKKMIHQKKAEPLSQKVVKGGMWVFGLRIINRGLGFVRTIVLARILAPEDFGLLGIAMLSISILETFSRTGFQAALIQKKENIESYLDTAWTVSVIRGTVLFFILFFSAPLIAKFFHSSQGVLVIRVIAVTTLLSGFKSIGIVFFQKELEFNKQFTYEFTATLVDLTVAITLAITLRNVWALVWGGLAANFARLLLSYVLHPYRPRICVAKDKFKDLMDFGKWVLASSILVFSVTQGDDIFVGKLLGITALGLYQMAYTLSNLPATEITHVISQVTFPAYSKLQDDSAKLKDAYIKVLHLTAFLSFPIAAGIIVLASDFTQMFLGPKWMPAVPVIQVLALAGLARSLAATAGYLFYAVAKTKIDTGLQLLRLTIMVAIIYPMSSYMGLLGVALTVLISILIASVGFHAMAIKLTKCTTRQFLKIITIPCMNGVFTATVLMFLKSYFSRGFVNFFLLVLIAMSIYIFTSLISEKYLKYEVKALTYQIIISLRAT